MPDENTSTSTSGTVDLTEAVKSIISKAGEPNQAVEMLLKENYAERQKRRDLKIELDALKKDHESLTQQRTVQEGETVLSGDDAKAWELFKEQGGLEAFQSATQELSSLKRDKQLSDVAAVMGWSPKVLTRIGGDLEYEIKTDGKEPTVLVKDGDSFKPLSEYAEAEWKDFAPSLHGASTTRTVVGQSPIDKSKPRTVTDEDIKADQDQRINFSI